MRPRDFGAGVLTFFERLPASFIFLFYCLIFVHPLFDDTLPGLKVHASVVHGVGSDKQLKRDLLSGSHPGILSGRPQFTATFIQSFVRFDRKQNTRVWPFVDAGTTRSPPRLFL